MNKKSGVIFYYPTLQREGYPCFDVRLETQRLPGAVVVVGFMVQEPGGTFLELFDPAPDAVIWTMIQRGQIGDLIPYVREEISSPGFAKRPRLATAKEEAELRSFLDTERKKSFGQPFDLYALQRGVKGILCPRHQSLPVMISSDSGTESEDGRGSYHGKFICDCTAAVTLVPKRICGTWDAWVVKTLEFEARTKEFRAPLA